MLFWNSDNLREIGAIFRSLNFAKPSDTFGLISFKKIFTSMKFKNPVVGKFYNYLSLKSKEAYGDPFLISNVVLCKQETRGRVFETYHAGEAPLSISFFLKINKIFAAGGCDQRQSKVLSGDR